MSQSQAASAIGRLLEPLRSRVSVEIFGALIGIATVAVPEEVLADSVGRDHSCEEWQASLEELAANALIARWAADDGGPIVTLTRLSAEAAGVRLNARSTRWVPTAVRDRSLKVKGEGPAITEADLPAAGEEYSLEDYPDPGAVDPADAIDAFEAATDKANLAGGLVKPLYLVGADDAWPLPSQDRGPWAPKDSRPPIQGACDGCRDSVTGEELCLSCGRWWADAKIPPSLHSLVARSPVAARDAEAREARKKEGRRADLARSIAAAGERAGRVVLVEPDHQESYPDGKMARKVTIVAKDEWLGEDEGDAARAGEVAGTEGEVG